MKKIGFIGLGTMGEPMAVNLIRRGYFVTVYNRNVKKTAKLASLGAEVAGSPAEVARSVDVLFTMMSDDDALREVYLSSEGIIHGVHPGLTVIDCSTVSAELSIRCHKELSEHAVDFLDAPVIGSLTEATNGTLVFVVGGQQKVLVDHIDILHALGSKVLYMGPPGSGSRTKLAHNAIAAINLAALSEGLSIATKSGIDPGKFMEVILDSAASSRQAELRGDQILNRDFSSPSPLQLMLKDLNLTSDLSQQLQLPTPLLQSAKNLYQMASNKGLDSQDPSAVIQCYEDWMQLKIARDSAVIVAAKTEIQVASSAEDRRRDVRIPMNIELQLSIYQWEQEGSFSGQNIVGTLYDLSKTGLSIASSFPLAKDMFVVIHFPEDADLPPIMGKIIRIEATAEMFRYGCMLSGLQPYTRIKLEDYIERHLE